MRQIFFYFIAGTALFLAFIVTWPKQVNVSQAFPASFWKVRSIDTMKFSRDLAREKLKDQSYLASIDQQVRLISETGASHIAIGTPYDPEFLPFLKSWVRSARDHKLSVWFRGNWSGWEEWFDYPIITPSRHLELTRDFISQNRDLFADGDIFTSCPECENGGTGDPRQTGKVDEHRKFLVDLYKTCVEEFKKHSLTVKCNYFSMNGDVANLLMDRGTVQSLGWVIVVDHYVDTPEKLVADLKRLHDKTGAQIVLGEWGAPIPDIHGRFAETEQAKWLDSALSQLVGLPGVVGINYWTNSGSSTELWKSGLTPKLSAMVIKDYYSPKEITLQVKNIINEPIVNSSAYYMGRNYPADSTGTIHLPYVHTKEMAKISSNGHKTAEFVTQSPDQPQVLILEKIDESMAFKLKKLLFSLSHSKLSN